jgi:hypothetical protein
MDKKILYLESSITNNTKYSKTGKTKIENYSAILFNWSSVLNSSFIL